MEGSALLAEYLKTHGLTLRTFAAQIEAPFSLVWRWVQPGSTASPGIRYALAVESATRGAVPVRAWVRRASGRSPRKLSDRSR